MNICFLARPCFDQWSPALAKQIRRKEKNTRFYFITTTPKETASVRAKIEDGTVFETTAFIREHWAEGTLSKLAELESKYECAPIWKYIYTDRFLIYRSYEDCIRITVGLFLFFEEIFSQNQVDAYYSEPISTLMCYVAYLVGKKHGVLFYTQAVAHCNADLYHYISCDPLKSIPGFHEADPAEGLCSPEDYQRATDFLVDFEAREKRPPYMRFVRVKPRITWKTLLLPGKRAVEALLFAEQRKPYAYMDYRSYRSSTDKLVFYFRYQFSKRYYHAAEYDRKFVYFPLHYQPEGTTLVCAQKYEKQLFFIDSLAKSLPADTVLYVKEHYSFLGNRVLSFYKALKQYPNVVLIHPLESSRRLIESATAVVTLAGTSGWEAMLLRRPVLVSGEVLFHDAPGVIKIDDIYEEYLPAMEKWKQPTREEVIHYLAKYFHFLYEGNAYVTDPSALSEENMEKLAVALINEMKRHKDKSET